MLSVFSLEGVGMVKIIRLVSMWVLALAVVLPFFHPWHFSVVADWPANAICIFFIGSFLLLNVSRNDWPNEVVVFPRAFWILLALTFPLMLTLQYNIPFYGVVFFLLAWLSFQVSSLVNCQNGRKTFVIVLAKAILVAALLQSVIGFVQAVRLSPYLYGLVVYSPDAVGVMGNFGQRNLLAQFLCWGVVAGCYLFSIGQLSRIITGCSIFVLSILIAWSGARLPFAYGLGTALLSWLWLRRGDGNAYVKKMVLALTLSIVLLAIVQIFNQNIMLLLHSMGISVNVESGSDRLMEAGFGARRYIEWSKAWSIFIEHPWLGVGIGGYAWQSAWLEAFGGWPKTVEGVLFTHCHNLIFQLLAETGIVGTVSVGGGLLYCLLPYFKRGEQTVENLLLVLIAMMLLVHSMLEYPLWYLPFLFMLVLICVLGPGEGVTLKFGRSFNSSINIGIAGLALSYVLFGVAPFQRLAFNFSPLPMSKPYFEVSLKNAKRSMELAKLARNPLWSWEAELSMVNYLQPDGPLRDLQRELVERVAFYRPLPGVLLKLAVLRALTGQETLARQALIMAIANYPQNTPYFQHDLAQLSQPEIRPLQLLASRAVAAGAAQGGDTDAGRLAAVMAVAAPVTRKPMFGGL